MITPPLPQTPCIQWLGGIHRQSGYGYIYTRIDGKLRQKQAHRWVWEYVNGAVPAGLELDHLCNNPPCVRLDHLEPVTGAENRRRGKDRRTTCRKGHPRTPENTLARMASARNGTNYELRTCRICNRINNHNTAARRKAGLLPQAVAEDQHGSLTGYSKGCRCGACVEASREAGRRSRQQFRTRGGVRPVSSQQHGTTTGYQNGCRCADCRASSAAYARARRAKLATL